MRHSERSPLNGRFVKIDPVRDLVPVSISAEDTYVITDTSIGWPPAPEVTDVPDHEPLHPRSRVDEYGLRDPYGRVDQHLVERAQQGATRDDILAGR